MGFHVLPTDFKISVIEISPNNRSTDIVKNWQQPRTSPQQWWSHQFLISCTHVNHWIFIAQHPHTMWMRQGDKHLSHCRFFKKNCPQGKYFDSSDSGRTTACRPPFLTLITHIPHKHAPKAMWMCRGKMVHKNCKHMKWLLIVACHEWIYFILLVDNLTCFSSMLFFIYQQTQQSTFGYMK